MFYVIYIIYYVFYNKVNYTKEVLLNKLLRIENTFIVFIGKKYCI